MIELTKNSKGRNKMKTTYIKITFAFVVILLMAGVSNVTYAQDFASDPQFKVKIDFNRWHDVDELWSDMKRLEKAFPKFLKVGSAGKSYNGQDIMYMTINNPETGPEMSKAAMYIDANIHGNEIQGGEICLYTIWYLMENYGRIDKVTQLVDERVFYIFPTVNPDGRQYFMEGDGNGARSGHVPVDDDNDGLYDEDGPNDLNGNGVIEQIRMYVPGKGDMRISSVDKRILEPVPYGETGDYILLGSEGIDDDGDGEINEDGPGAYDPNRNWAVDWQPDYVQSGAMDYPFQLPEARAINNFLMSHPNIAGAQAYHNNGGMILRGPGAESLGEFPASDARFYDELGQNGERILPFYRYIVIWSGLYTVHGGFTDWTNDGLGIISFSNELWNGRQYFTSAELEKQTEDPNSVIAGQKGDFFFDDYLEFGDEYVDWKEFNHPVYGKVEMGGRWKKTRGRVPPRFMNEELCHRNMAFTLYQADEMPLMKMGDHKVEKLGNGVYKVWVEFSNPKVAPTITEKAAQNNVVRPDLLTFEGNMDIISAGWVDDPKTDTYLKPVTQEIDQHDLKRIMIRNGHPGKTSRTIQYVVKGSGKVNIKYDSVKGGTISTSFDVK
ncbi:MAG: peptidase M14 [Prolixibacteraceae bacterium]|nr:peptidase M14 [Prolixibacteraceae bacterium]